MAEHPETTAALNPVDTLERPWAGIPEDRNAIPLARRYTGTTLPALGPMMSGTGRTPAPPSAEVPPPTVRLVSDPHQEPAPKAAPRVVVVIPAYNESETIAGTLESVFAQTVHIDDVYVLADHCTDDTVTIAHSFPISGVVEVDVHANPDKKAGILNICMLQRPGLFDALDDDDFVMSIDADTVLVPDFIEKAIATLEADPRIGSVCASYRGFPGRPGVIHLLQRNEYDRFARIMERRGARAWILSGVCQFYRIGVLKEVYWGRINETLPGNPGEIWDSVSATEDIELTMAVRALGYGLRAPRDCVVYTDTMPTWSKLASQRKRWQRGMLDSLHAYGIRKMTLEYVVRQLGLYLGCLGVPLYLVVLGATLIINGHITYQLWWLVITALFVFERTVTVRKSGWKAMALAFPLVPEYLYEVFRSFVYWRALYEWVRKRERHWEIT